MALTHCGSEDLPFNATNQAWFAQDLEGDGNLQGMGKYSQLVEDHCRLSVGILIER